MLGKDKLELAANEFDEALNLGDKGGKTCRTLGEVVEFVTKLVVDDRILPKLDPKGPYLTEKYPEIEPHRWWFRGAQSDCYELNAGLFRTRLPDVYYPTPTAHYGRLEQRIGHEYSLMTRGRFPGLSTDPWDRLFEIQHYGLPTRLLDWSFSLGQALWFALQPRDENFKQAVKEYKARRLATSNNAPSAKDDPDRTDDCGRPVIWILNPRLLASTSLGAPSLDDFAYLERHGSNEEIRAWMPELHCPEVRRPGWILEYLSRHPSGGHFPVLASWTNPRMAAQMGCFTLQSGVGEAKPRSLDHYAETTETKFLLKVCFDPDPDLLHKAYKALSMIGVNKYTLFPEMHETCAWIKELRNLRR
jgi:hypothetical protein